LKARAPFDRLEEDTAGRLSDSIAMFRVCALVDYANIASSPLATWPGTLVTAMGSCNMAGDSSYMGTDPSRLRFAASAARVISFATPLESLSSPSKQLAPTPLQRLEFWRE
jgi:hypothetical protein